MPIDSENMKTNLFRGILPTLLMATVATPVLAGPLRRADVPADPAWLLHVNCDGLRPTALGQFVEEQLAKPAQMAKLAAFQALFNFDLRSQLHGVTLYGLGAAPRDGILLVYADFDPKRLVTLAEAAKDSQKTDYKQHVIYSWADQHKKRPSKTGARTYAALHGSCVVFGQREDRVAQALDVLDGTSANLAASQALPQFGVPGDTSLLEAGARKLDLPGTDPHAEILRLSKVVGFQLAEAQQQVTAVLHLEANDAEVAGHILSIGQGLLSLAKLQKENPASMKAAEAMTLKQDGAQVLANLSLPAADFIQLLQAHAARKAAAKAATTE